MGPSGSSAGIASSLHHAAGMDISRPAQAISPHSAAPTANIEVALVNPADLIKSIWLFVQAKLIDLALSGIYSTILFGI